MWLNKIDHFIARTTTFCVEKGVVLEIGQAKTSNIGNYSLLVFLDLVFRFS
jgi:hypothetical protein